MIIDVHGHLVPPDFLAAIRKERGRVQHVLDYLKAHERVELRAQGCQLLDAAGAIIDVQALGSGVTARRLDVFHGRIKAGHLRAKARQRLRQDAAAAADIEYPFARKARVRVDPVEANRIQFMQRFEFGIRVPPAMREIAEFLQFVGIGVGHKQCSLEGRMSGGSDKP